MSLSEEFLICFYEQHERYTHNLPTKSALWEPLVEDANKVVVWVKPWKTWDKPRVVGLEIPDVIIYDDSEETRDRG